MLLYRFCSVLLFRFLRAISKYKPPGAYIRRGDLTKGLLRSESGRLIFGGLIHGGAYFWNFTVFNLLFFCLFVLFLVCLLSFFLRGGVGKSVAPVRSLRDLMQEEEQQLSGKKAETKETPSAATSKANKSGTPRKKLKYDTPPHYPFIKLDISHVLNVSRRTQFVTEHRCLITRLTSPKFH